LGVDAVAAFFTAAMYQSGIGLPRDPLRACALYTRAGLIYSDTKTWFERLNAALAPHAYIELPEDERELCVLLASIGFEHRFEPATFYLGPEHSAAVHGTPGSPTGTRPPALRGRSGVQPLEPGLRV
jgi:hypothetical protein